MSKAQIFDLSYHDNPKTQSGWVIPQEGESGADIELTPGRIAYLRRNITKEKLDILFDIVKKYGNDIVLSSADEYYSEMEIIDNEGRECLAIYLSNYEYYYLKDGGSLTIVDVEPNKWFMFNSYADEYIEVKTEEDVYPIYVGEYEYNDILECKENAGISEEDYQTILNIIFKKSEDYSGLVVQPEHYYKLKDNVKNEILNTIKEGRDLEILGKEDYSSYVGKTCLAVSNNCFELRLIPEDLGVESPNGEIKRYIINTSPIKIPFYDDYYRSTASEDEINKWTRSMGYNEWEYYDIEISEPVDLVVKIPEEFKSLLYRISPFFEKEV